jgi:hypothetical protein
MEKRFVTSDGRTYDVCDCTFIPDEGPAERASGIYVAEYDYYNQKCWEGVCGNILSVSLIPDPVSFDFALENECWDSYYKTLESVKIV